MFVDPAGNMHYSSYFEQVCAGDLGTNAQLLEERLSKILSLVCRWNAILLLDEADVFLECRSRHGLEYNALVSVFLRQLEYSQGIIFLTTNRVTMIDEAIQNRIHLGLKYDDLKPLARESIWKAFLQQANSSARVKSITGKELKILREKDINGRQVR